MYPIEYMWISAPTPVTNRHMMIESGSASSARSTCSAPTGIHVKITSTLERSSELIPSMSMYTPTETTNDAATISVAIHPASGSPRRRPRSRMIRNPASGKAGINQSTSSTVASALQLGEIVGGGTGTGAQDRHEDAEAHHGLGGGNHHHEEHRRLAVDVAELHRQGDETQVRRVEHQLDAHDHHERVAPYQEPDRA